MLSILFLLQAIDKNYLQKLVVVVYEREDDPTVGKNDFACKSSKC